MKNQCFIELIIKIIDFFNNHIITGYFMLKNNIELFLKHKNSKKIKNRIDLLNKFPKNSIGIELGVHLGDFSDKILQIVNPRKFHLVDSWDCIPLNKPAAYSGIYNRDLFVKKRFESSIKKNKLFIHKNYSHEALNFFENNYFDWIYIDANHDYDFVKFDIYNWSNKIKNDGLICGHDYCWKSNGVVKAVDEFINDKNWQLIYHTVYDKFPSWILKKKI